MLSMSPWFAAQWERSREKRVIAELEELARMLVVVWGTGVRP
jgi:hypothetical protein